MKEMVGGCCVCSDERGWPENPLVYCDGQNCTVAVHQACYGIVTVPTGPWYCRKCESQERSARVRCELCPSRDGALKKTDNSSWAHVVCALYIPEVRFGNVTTMEPIILQLIPPERYAKTCCICQELGKGSRANVGACMQCNKGGCRQQFHVTCAQALGLLCEEAGNYLDNVKYCGYCQHHYSKLKKGGNVKTIPPYKPITHEAGSSDSPSSPEKEGEATTGGAASAATGSSAAPSQKSSQPSTATGSASTLPASATSTASTTSSTKQRKSSSTSKGAASSAATLSTPTTATSTVTPQLTPSLSVATSSPVLATGGVAGAPTIGKIGLSGGGGSKEKDKHSRSGNKVSGSKEKDSFRDKTSKSSSKNQSKEDLNVSSMKSATVSMDYKVDKTGVLVSAAASTTTTKSSSIIAPSILQTSKELMSGKDAGGKFTSSNFTESIVVNSEPVFGSDNSKGSNSSTSSTVAKKRKADTAKLSSVDDVNKDLIKDVSVTLVPLVSVDKLDLGEVKKVRTEITATSTASLQASANEGGTLVNPLMSSASTTTMSLMKQHGLVSSQPMPATQPTTSIIKPPVMKDVGDLSRVQPSASPFAATPAESAPTQSIRVSVPLSTASVAGINLPTNNNSTSTSGLMSPNMPSTSSASHVGSLFQQALHNRSAEQMGSFGNVTRMGATSSQPGSRSSPVVQMPLNHQSVHLHHSPLERHSPHVQTASPSPLLNHPAAALPPEQTSTPVSVAPAVSALQNLSPIGMHSQQMLSASNTSNMRLESDSGMLKITYEKQPNQRVATTPVQEEVTQPGRRSSKSRASKKRPSTSTSSSSTASATGKTLVACDSITFPTSTECTFSITNSHTTAVASSGGLNHTGAGDMMMGGMASFGLTTTDQPQVAAKATRATTRGLMNETPPPHSTSRTPDTSTNFGTATATSATSFGGLKFTYESQPGTSSASATTPVQIITSIGAVTKDSPPSSPGSEAGASTRKRTRKQTLSQESKDLKIFQNGIHVTHMLGNQLNPASSVAQKMSDQLNMEIEAHSVYSAPAMDNSPQLVGPPFPGKNTSFGKNSSSQQGPPSLTTVLGAGSGSSTGSGTTPQSLEQLLERQWEQGSQFLMEQAQHFDIASLLSCLHQLQTENIRLEEHVNNLVTRRDHLLAVNARLAIPLANPATGSGQVQFNSMNINGPAEGGNVSAARTSSRSSTTGQPFTVQPMTQQQPAPQAQSLQQIPVENGVDFRHSAVSSVTITSHQPPPGGNIRHSPVTQQPFVGGQVVAASRQPSGGSSSGGVGVESSRSRGPAAGTAGVYQTQQSASSYQKLALLQQQAQTIRRDDGQVKPS
ncbi:protein AF-10 [Sergentomyia squamirostris]